MAIADVFPVHDTSLDLLELRHRRREAALQQFVGAASMKGVLRHPEALLAHLMRRERLGTTALGRGFALTGAWSWSVRSPFVLVGLSARGLDWRAADGQPVTLAACVLTPGESPMELHLRRLGAVHAALRLQRVRQRVAQQADPAWLARLLHEEAR
jgi:mannitol/fructose-specific phosphotransferase system IIA component (Ntr-type)